MPDRRSFEAFSYANLGRIIPHDHISCLFRIVQTENRGLPALQTMECLSATKGCEKAVHDFNAHYGSRIPPPALPIRPVNTIDWRDGWSDTEYYADYLRPLGIRFSNDPRFTISVHRGPSRPAFADEDLNVFYIIAHHLVNIYSFLEKLGGPAGGNRPTSFDLSRLTRREAEIVHLLFLRLSALEISRRLGISRRTVEKHIADMYQKFGAYDRHGLLRRLY